MRFFVIFLLVAVSGCSGMNRGKWPSLAPRPGEVSPMVPRTPLGGCPGCGQDVFAKAAAPPPVVLPPPADMPVRLDAVDRAIGDVAENLPAQRRAMDAAIARAAAQPGDSNAASTAEVERSRLEALFIPLSIQSRALDMIDDDLIGKSGAETLVARAQALRARLAALQAVRP